MCGSGPNGRLLTDEAKPVVAGEIVPLAIPVPIQCREVQSLALGETMDDLVERDGLTYKKFSDVPFTGKVTGNTQGSFKDGILR